jgi:hypothetical protein
MPVRYIVGDRFEPQGRVAEAAKTTSVMDGNAKIKVIKKGDKPPAKPEEIYQREHELGLLHILIRKYPQEVQKIVEKWKLNVA